MRHNTIPFILLLSTIATGIMAHGQPPSPVVSYRSTVAAEPASAAGLPATLARHPSPDRPHAVTRVASPPSASNLAYPQSLFVDSRNGNIWVADFDNNRVLRFDVSSLTGVGESPGPPAPQDYALGQNYPNPFNPGTTITFALRSTGPATVTVYDLLGRSVATLFDAVATAHTRYSLSFDAAGLPGGIYFYRLRSAGVNEVRKMGVVK